jgi:hypothetical protein
MKRNEMEEDEMGDNDCFINFRDFEKFLFLGV